MASRTSSMKAGRLGALNAGTLDDVTVVDAGLAQALRERQ